jgi:nucleoside triphosphate diphosphatase
MTDDPRLEGLASLLQIVDRLRAPDGCPWDKKQTLRSMAPHLLEEAYECMDALRNKEDGETVGECGDLLMILFLIGRIGEDEGRFSMANISRAVCEKLLRRHPHVFGEEQASDAREALSRWEAVKQEERAGKGEKADRSVLSGVPRELPALLRAHRVGEKAAAIGFDWPEARGPLDKIEEEFQELRSEIEAGERDPDRTASELGDLLFSLVNLSRHLGLNPEMALRGTVDRFESRFRQVEESLGDRMGRGASLEEMEKAWEIAKLREASGLSENRRDSDG